MAQNSQPLDLAEALQRLFATLPRVDRVEMIPLADALNRVLAQAVNAPIDLPPFPASAMDGYAVRAADLADTPPWRFTEIGQSLAGHPFDGGVNAGECVRIFTGAKVPPGADQVLLQEEVAAIDGATVHFKPHTPGESFVRPIGHDVSRGTQLAAAHDVVNAFTVGTLAAAGIENVQVYAKPRVGVFSTGDELVDPGTPPAQLSDGQIYDSNRLTVLKLLQQMPCELHDLGRLPDDQTAVHAAFQAASANCEFLITSGGVSVGEADFVTAAIEQLGTLEFWRLNLKPGKPLAFGRMGSCHVFGLPGNPVSTIVTLLMVARPAIWHFAGANPSAPLGVRAKLTAPLSHSPGRAEYQRGIYFIDGGNLMVAPTGDQSSNRMRTFHGANCLIEVDKQAADLPAGGEVTLLPFSGLLD